MGDYLQTVFDPILEFLLMVFKIAGMTGVVVLCLATVITMLSSIYNDLAQPYRRAERARMFLDLLAYTIKQDKPLEETIISLSHSRDESMGLDFHLLAAWLEQGLPLDEALTKVPQFLPPQVRAMLRAGRQIGDLAKVLPAARHLLTDATSKMRGAMNYLSMLTLITIPASCGILGVLGIFVLPRFLDVIAGMGVTAGAGLAVFLTGHWWTLMEIQAAILGMLGVASQLYIGGPRTVARFPILEKLHYRLPWRRKRMQRDFSTMLAILLDAGAPEAAALTLAADCSANSVFRRRAARAVVSLRQGLKLPEAIEQLDDAGEFRWRLRNAVAASGGFFRALAGWHESLDARAFQEEQAAAQVITTSLVLWSGLIVGLIICSFFMVLISFVTTATLW